MRLTRLGDANAYQAPKHFDCTALRLHGAETAGGTALSVGLSHFLPAGGCERDATPLEKVYVVTDGEVTVVTDEGEATLSRYDALHLAADEARSIENRTNLPASMIVVMPSPASSR